VVSGKTLDMDIRWLEQGIREVVWESIAERYREPLRNFYNNLLKDLKKVLKDVKEGKVKPGNKKYKSKPFEDGIIQLFKDMYRDREPDIDNSVWLTMKDDYRVCFGFGGKSEKWKKREMDIKIAGKSTINQNQKVFYIEIKYNLDMDEFGSALMKSILTEKEKNSKFYIVSLRKEGKCDYRELCKKDPFRRYIDGVIYFGPKYDPELKDVIKLLQEIDSSI